VAANRWPSGTSQKGWAKLVVVGALAWHNQSADPLFCDTCQTLFTNQACFQMFRIALCFSDLVML
jgi:hypothetical protein